MMNSKKGPKLLVDGDLILYRAAAGCEQESSWGEIIEGEGPVITLTTSIPSVKRLVKATIKGIAKDLKASEICVCFSDDINYRKLVFPDYKSNRLKTRKPVGWGELTEWRKSSEFPFKTFSRPLLEADDCIGIGLTNPKAGNIASVSDDKDFLSIPGKFYRIGMRDRKPEKFKQDELAADLFFYKQILMGDAVDGYKGVPNVGEKGATKVVDATFNRIGATEATVELEAAMWKAIVNEYNKKHLTETDALTNARMARILRWEDYNHEKGVPKLWVPKCGLIGGKDVDPIAKKDIFGDVINAK